MDINIIYMAAGNSRRFGTNKLLHPIDGKPMYLYGLERLLEIVRQHPGWRIFVVTQYGEILERVRMQQASEILPMELMRSASGILSKELLNLNHCLSDEEHAQIYGIYSAHSRDGVSFTIRAGLAAAEQFAPHGAGYAFFTADQPYLSEATILRFLETVEYAQPELGSMRFGDTPGNPAYFSKQYLPELLALAGDTGGRRILKKHPEKVLYVDAAEAQELYDIDVPEAQK